MKTKVKKMWARYFQNCSNCKTTRLPHKGRGYCSRCKNQMRVIETAMAWDWSRPQTLRNWKPRSDRSNNQVCLERAKERKIREATRRLSFYRRKEEKLNSPIRSQDILKQLQFFAMLIQGRYRPLRPGLANDIAKNFCLPKRKALFGILNEVIEALKLRGGRGLFTEEKWTC